MVFIKLILKELHFSLNLKTERGHLLVGLIQFSVKKKNTALIFFCYFIFHQGKKSRTMGIHASRKLSNKKSYKSLRFAAFLHL